MGTGWAVPEGQNPESSWVGVGWGYAGRRLESKGAWLGESTECHPAATLVQLLDIWWVYLGVGGG